MAVRIAHRPWPAVAALTVVLGAAAVLGRVWPETDALPVRTIVVEPIAAGTDGLALPNVPGSLRVAVIGDAGRGDVLQYDTANELARWHDRFDFDLVLMLGDNMYGEDTVAEYARRFERPYKLLLDDRVIFQAVLGNHDPPGQPAYPPFNMQDRRYYTFVKAVGVLKPVAATRVQFFALDTVRLDGVQLEWLRGELSRSTADWKIAFYHHPLYTSGRYRLSAGRIRRALEPLFVRYGVDVGLSGHEHFYERLVPRQGVQYFTSGAAGALRAGDLRDSPLTAAGFDTDTHFLLLEITGDVLYFQAISRTGQTVDAGRFERASDPAPPPSLRK